MSGDIQDLPIRRCPRCGTIYVEDSSMYEDTNICPNCGADVSAAEDYREEIDHA